MISKDIYAIISTKPHNAHFLKRYVKFIQFCKEKNSTQSLDYTEQHHICPKASDMFPEYIDLIENKWNSVHLTARQHITAHILLWKAFPNITSTCATIHYMCNVQNSNLCSISGRVIPKAIHNRYSAKSREEFYESRKGFYPYKDADNNKYFVHSADPIIQEKNLVGLFTGMTHSEESKQKMSSAKDSVKSVIMKFLTYKRIVKINSEDFELHLAQGWTVDLTDDDRELIREIQYNKVSAAHKGRSDYMYPDGTYYGKLTPDDPAIEELNLMHHMTPNRLTSALENQKRAVEANLGTTWYNNGIINKKFKYNPGYEWVVGQINISDESKKARADGCRKVRQNKKCYNDGTNNFYFYDHEQIPSGMIPGMAKQKKRNVTSKNSNYETWNDGVKSYRVYPSETPNSSWIRGMLKQSKIREYCFTDGVSFIIRSSNEDFPGWTKCKRPKHI
jgi:hypothetical protein